jgi:hypothetical protein
LTCDAMSTLCHICFRLLTRDSTGHVLNVCVSHKTYILKLSLQCGLKRWGLGEVIRLQLVPYVRGLRFDCLPLGPSGDIEKVTFVRNGSY